LFILSCWGQCFCFSISNKFYSWFVAILCICEYMTTKMQPAITQMLIQAKVIYTYILTNYN
jgi:hypothetical protein